MNDLITDKKQKFYKLCNEIEYHKEQVKVNLYEIGCRLNIIKAQELYLVDYPTFKTFLEKKIELAYGTSMQCMQISNEFSLRQFKDLGYSRCSILLSLDKSDRSEIEASKPVKDVRQQVSDYRTAEGIKSNESALKHKVMVPNDPDEKLKYCLRKGQIILDWIIYEKSNITNLENQVKTWKKSAWVFEKDQRIKNLREEIKEKFKFS